MRLASSGLGRNQAEPLPGADWDHRSTRSEEIVLIRGDSTFDLSKKGEVPGNVGNKTLDVSPGGRVRRGIHSPRLPRGSQCQEGIQAAGTPPELLPP